MDRRPRLLSQYRQRRTISVQRRAQILCANPASSHKCLERRHQWDMCRRRVNTRVAHYPSRKASAARRVVVSARGRVYRATTADVSARRLRPSTRLHWRECSAIRRSPTLRGVREHLGAHEEQLALATGAHLLISQTRKVPRQKMSFGPGSSALLHLLASASLLSPPSRLHKKTVINNATDWRSYIATLAPVYLQNSFLVPSQTTHHSLRLTPSLSHPHKRQIRKRGNACAVVPPQQPR